MSDLKLRLTPEQQRSTAGVIDTRQRRALATRITGDRGGRHPRSAKGGADARGVLVQTLDEGVVRTSPTSSTSSSGVRIGATSLSDAFGPLALVSAADTARRATAQHANVDTAFDARSASPHIAAAPADAPTSSDARTALHRFTAVGSGVEGTIASPTASPLVMAGALVVPAGALVRGYLQCRALLLAGDVVGHVHCTAGPVVIRAGASLSGRLVASGDVYVCGSVAVAGADTCGGAVISTRGKLTLAPGARVDGDVRSARLDIHDGAMLAGVAKACED